MDFIFRAAGTVAAMVLALPIPVGSADLATVETFTMVNAANLQGDPFSRGTLLKVLTSAPISASSTQGFDPWVTATPDGAFIEASCASVDDLAGLPIAHLETSEAGSVATVYWPNSTGPEPFGACANAGASRVIVHPAPGLGATMERPIATVNGHPEIFSEGQAPAGNHLDGDNHSPTPVFACNDMLPGEPNACRVRTLGSPAVLSLEVTGADPFVCDPCTASPVTFELALVANGNVGPYAAQFLLRIKRLSLGVELAELMVWADLPPGEYRLLVRNAQQPSVVRSPLTVEFGLPS